MGLYSWCCKGCGGELVEGELVRLNGCVGPYDGYGRAGAYDHSAGGFDPAAWHERCYRAASSEQKLDDSPSAHALNQGCGYPRLVNLPGYNHSAPIRYIPKVEGTDGDGWQDWYAVSDQDGELKFADHEAYRRQYAELNATGGVTDELFDSMPADANLQEFAKQVEAKIEEQIGPDPARIALSFSTFDEAIQVARRIAAMLPTGSVRYVMVLGEQQISAVRNFGLVYQEELEASCSKT